MDSVCLDEEVEVSTTNMRLAAALLAAGQDAYLVREKTNHSDRTRVVLYIRGKGLRKVQLEWDKSELMVNAKRLLASLQDVRTEIRGGGECG